MNRTSFTTRFNLFLTLILFSGAFQTAWAQGFFTPTDHAAGAGDTRFELLPDGYRAKSTYYHQLADVVYYFGDLQLNGAGEEIARDSVEWTTGLSGPFYTWLPDGDLLEAGSSFGGPNWTVRKLHLDGSLVWSQALTPALADQHIYRIAQNAAGEIFLLGHEYDPIPSGGAANIVLHKYGVNGTLLWTMNMAMPDSSAIESLILEPAHDGGCIYYASMYGPGVLSTYSLNKVSASGQISWSDPIQHIPYYIKENSQGEIYTYGIYSLNAQGGDVVLEKRSSSGQVSWTKHILLQHISGLYLAENEDVLAIGTENAGGQQNRNFFMRFDPAGNLLWKRHYAFLSDEWEGIITGGAATPDNGFVLAGLMPLTGTLFVLKTDANGNVYPSQLSGQLALDANVNCLNDPDEQALANWKVQLTGPDYTLYASTDSSGYYEMTDVPGDDYLLTAAMPSNLWESCAGDIPVTISATGAVSVVEDLPVQALAGCPFMTVDIATPVLRRCFSSYYSVRYCNEGPVATDSAYIEVVLDPLLQFNSASIPHTLNGDVLTFFLGTVQSLECGDFTFDITVGCDSTQLGQTLCVSAAIFPDSICNPPLNWSGGLLEGSGVCAGDSVRFQLRNTGMAPTSAGLDFIVVDDHVIMYQLPLPSLQTNDVFQITVPADGSTLRLIADQEPNAPGLEMPSVGVEGCGTGGPPSWGFLLQFPNRDGNPFTDRDCHEVVGSYDPNDKQALPAGVADEHWIEQNQPLDYQIRFQNTGTDTAFTVVVKDTLSAWLNPASVRPGAASHPYSWSLSGAGILTFTFENILLPDSNVNETASHGFIRFGIDQQPDVPLGTLLENRAGIYFDFNAPVMTNTVFHTVGHNFLLSAAPEAAAPLPLLQAWPNPAAQATTVWAEKPFMPGQRLLLRNALGLIVQEVAVQGPSIELQRAGKPAGLYFVELHDVRGVLGVGKLIWE